jgi:hypothetical protein
MKRAFATALIALAVGAFFPTLSSATRFQIVPTVGLGDELTCIGISHRDPKFVMIGTATGKIHRTIDGGMTWQEVVVIQRRDLFFGRERDGDPRNQYALGLPGKSPHLQSWLRQKGLHTSGINTQQLLVKEGDRPVSINWIEVDWQNENRVYIGSADGLYRSLDKGRTWQRLWQGRGNRGERAVMTVVTDPKIKKRLIVGTTSGLFVSKDGGVSFKKEMNFYVHGGYIRGLWYDRQNPSVVHMAMGGAAMASVDSGKNWITTHWHLWGPRSRVLWISLGPTYGKAILRAFGTEDGIWASWQGGEMGSWVRRGYRMIRETVYSVLLTKKPNVWYAATKDAIWVSEDFGNQWRKVMQLGGNETPRWLIAYDNDPRYMWLITNRHVYRWGGVRGNPRVMGRRGRLRRLMDIPSAQATWKKVMKYKHLFYKDIQDYRDLAPVAAILPELSIGIKYSPNRDYSLTRAFPLLHLPFHYYSRVGEANITYYAIAQWDLSRFIWERAEQPGFGRIERNLEGIRKDMTERVLRLHSEYLAIARKMVFGPPRNVLARELEKIRLQEIAAFFDIVTGGWWTKQAGKPPS